MKLNFKKGFTLIELSLIVTIMVLIISISLNSLASSQVKQKYDIAFYKIIHFIKKARISSMSNFTEYNKNGTASVKYLIPSGGYGVEIEKINPGIIHLKSFYNKNNDSKFGTGDTLIEEWKSGEGHIYVENIMGSGSNISFPSSNSGSDISNTSKITIIFRNFTGKYPNDGSVFISSGDKGDNNIKDLKLSLYMFFSNKKLFKKRISFDRISKIIKLQSCKKSDNTELESCGTGNREKWTLNF